MKNVIKLLTLSLLMIVSFSNLNAQKGKKQDPIKRAQMQTADIASKLMLDQATTDKLGAINLAYAEKQVAARAASKAKKKAGETMDKKALKAERKALQKAQSEEIKALLGKDKFKEYKKLMKKGKKGKKKGKKAAKKEMKEGLDNQREI